MFTIKTSTEKSLEFVLDGIDVGYANALRRIVLSEIPNVAIDVNDITISANTSSMHNEFLSKRISLLPICFDADEIEGFNEAEAAKYKFVIDKKGTGIGNVTTGDIEIFDEAGQPYPAAFVKKIFPVDAITKDHILLAWLKTDEVMRVEFYAKRGIALTHTRWCPVSTCTYHNTLDDAKVKAARALIDGSNEAELNKFDTLDKYRLFKINEFGEPCSFTFKIESECNLHPSYMVKRGLEILRTKVIAIESKTTVEVIHKETYLYALNVTNEDHTMGNMLQVAMYNNYVRKNKIIDFVGYFQPHPLDPNIIFKIRFLENMDDVKRFLNEALRLTAASITEMHDEWTKALLDAKTVKTVKTVKKKTEKAKASTKKSTVK